MGRSSAQPAGKQVQAVLMHACASANQLLSESVRGGESKSTKLQKQRGESFPFNARYTPIVVVVHRFDVELHGYNPHIGTPCAQSELDHLIMTSKILLRDGEWESLGRPSDSGAPSESIQLQPERCTSQTRDECPVRIKITAPPGISMMLSGTGIVK